MIKALKNNGEREIEVVGTDMRPEAGGRFFADRFYTVPPGHPPEFIPRLIEIVEREHPDVLFPQSSYEVYPLALHRDEFEGRGVPVIVAEQRAIELSNDKGLMYRELEGTDIPCPQMRTCSSLAAFTEAVRSLGYPERPVCFKPTISKGSRGFRILSAGTDRVDMLITRRVDETTMTLEEAVDILKEAAPFPSLVVSEFIEGKEHTVDVFCQDGQVLMGFVKTREAIKAGLAMYFEMVDRPDLRRYGEEVARGLGLDYFANIQFCPPGGFQHAVPGAEICPRRGGQGATKGRRGTRPVYAADGAILRPGLLRRPGPAELNTDAKDSRHTRRISDDPCSWALCLSSHNGM